jgi:hypothetical protein
MQQPYPRPDVPPPGGVVSLFFDTSTTPTSLPCFSPWLPSVRALC